MTDDKVYEIKRAASKARFDQEAGTTVDHTTPSELTTLIQDFASSLCSDAPVWVPVVPDQYGLFAWCVDGVQEKIAHEGGSMLFGWIFWEWPGVLVTAEFHAVWVDDKGGLHDITPKPHGQTKVLFLPDKTYPSDFDFNNRPRNRRYRIYQPINREDIISKKIAQMKPAQLKYETNRAEKEGASLKDWLLKKLEPDELPDLIDEYIATNNAVETRLDTLAPQAGQEIPFDKELIDLAKKGIALTNKIRGKVKE